MIEMDARRISECGIHVRLPAPNRVRIGTRDCPACRTLMHAARTEPITQGPNRARREAGVKGGQASAAVGHGVRLSAMDRSDRTVAVRTRAGGRL